MIDFDQTPEYVRMLLKFIPEKSQQQQNNIKPQIKQWNRHESANSFNQPYTTKDSFYLQSAESERSIATVAYIFKYSGLLFLCRLQCTFINIFGWKIVAYAQRKKNGWKLMLPR